MITWNSFKQKKGLNIELRCLNTLQPNAAEPSVSTSPIWVLLLSEFSAELLDGARG